MKEELEFHATAWRLAHLGERGELQLRGREREAEMPGDHTTSVDSSGQHIMVEGTESESLTSRQRASLMTRAGSSCTARLD